MMAKISKVKDLKKPRKTFAAAQQDQQDIA